MKSIEKICKKCGEKIYGLSEKDVDYKMVLHNLKHRIKIKDTKGGK